MYLYTHVLVYIYIYILKKYDIKMQKVLINSKTVQYKYVNLIEQTPKTNFGGQDHHMCGDFHFRFWEML